MKEPTRLEKLFMLALALRGGEAKQEDIIKDVQEELQYKNEVQLNYLWAVGRERLKDFKPSA